MNPQVSICVPVYNGSKYLKESLLSICRQSYRFLEILIVDDCSTDNSLQIIQELQKEDHRIRVVKNVHQLGLVANWNKCIELASSDWVKFQFQDDEMHPDAIDKMVKLAMQNNVRLVLSDREYIFEKNREKKKDFFDHKLKRLSHKYFKTSLISSESLGEIFNEWGMKYNFLGEPILGLFHRDLIAQYGNYDQRLKHVVDMEFWLRIGLNESFVFTPNKLHIFRVHEDSQGAKNISRKGFNPAHIDKVNICKKILMDQCYASYRLHFGESSIRKILHESIKKMIRVYGYWNTKRVIKEDMVFLKYNWTLRLEGFWRDVVNLVKYGRNFS